MCLFLIFIFLATNFFLEFVFLILLDRFEKAISSQPIADVLCTDHVKICGSLLILTGTVLVLSSFLSLGILGTFLGMINIVSLSLYFITFLCTYPNNFIVESIELHSVWFQFHRCKAAKLCTKCGQLNLLSVQLSLDNESSQSTISHQHVLVYSPYHWSIASTQIAVRVINNKDFNLLMYQKPNKGYTECKLIIDTFIF